MGAGIDLIFRSGEKIGFDHWDLGFCYWEWCEWDLHYQRSSGISSAQNS